MGCTYTDRRPPNGTVVVWEFCQDRQFSLWPFRGVHLKGKAAAGRIRTPSARSSAITSEPSVMPKRRRSEAGITTAPRLPTLLVFAGMTPQPIREIIRLSECQALLGVAPSRRKSKRPCGSVGLNRLRGGCCASFVLIGPVPLRRASRPAPLIAHGPSLDPCLSPESGLVSSGPARNGASPRAVSLACESLVSGD